MVESSNALIIGIFSTLGILILLGSIGGTGYHFYKKYKKKKQLESELKQKKTQEWNQRLSQFEVTVQKEEQQRRIEERKSKKSAAEMLLKAEEERLRQQENERKVAEAVVPIIEERKSKKSAAEMLLKAEEERLRQQENERKVAEAVVPMLELQPTPPSSAPNPVSEMANFEGKSIMTSTIGQVSAMKTIMEKNKDKKKEKTVCVEIDKPEASLVLKMQKIGASTDLSSKKSASKIKHESNHVDVSTVVTKNVIEPVDEKEKIVATKIPNLSTLKTEISQVEIPMNLMNKKNDEKSDNSVKTKNLVVQNALETDEETNNCPEQDDSKRKKFKELFEQ
uniref:Uncharacterized protein n=1 Tax=Panagrolaimus sp. JU765 TaxID=591449 RepID=A0AC34Q1S6_9BILA